VYVSEQVTVYTLINISSEISLCHNLPVRGRQERVYPYYIYIYEMVDKNVTSMGSEKGKNTRLFSPTWYIYITPHTLENNYRSLQF
jgi:hypothetical protein